MVVEDVWEEAEDVKGGCMRLDSRLLLSYNSVPRKVSGVFFSERRSSFWTGSGSQGAER